MENQPITLQTGEQLDPKIVKVMRAIRQTETGSEKDPYNAIGDNGAAHGAYQFNEKTGMGWKNYAKTYLGDENAPMTPENQNKAMYGYVKEKKDSGLLPDEIAAMHNGAKKDPITGKYTYLNPEYGNKFRQALTGQTQTNITPTVSTQTSQPQEETLGTQLSNRGKEAVGAIQGTISGKINPLSGLIQTAGAAAGALGDVVNKGLELIPGVKQLEGLIGQGVGTLANTEAGKSVVKSIDEFSKAHPELSKDIGAGFNIITAIPILKGLGVVKNLAMDSVGLALKDVAEKGATKDLTEVLSRTISGKKALTNNPEAIQTLVKERIMPDIEDGKYATKNVSENLNTLIDQKDDVLDNILKSETKSGTKPVVSLTELRNDALASAEKSLEGQSNYKSVINKINEFFDTAENSKKTVKFGDDYLINLEDANFFKRQARKGLTWDDTVGRDAGFHVGQSYMKGIEKEAAKYGLKDVSAANQDIAKLIKAQNVLKYIDNKPVKLTKGGKVARTVGTEIGAFGGGLIAKGLGLPEVASTFLGGSGGRFLGGKTGGLVRGLRESVLSRTGKNSTRVGLKEATKKTTGLIGTSAITHPKK